MNLLAGSKGQNSTKYKKGWLDIGEILAGCAGIIKQKIYMIQLKIIDNLNNNKLTITVIKQ